MQGHLDKQAYKPFLRLCEVHPGHLLTPLTLPFSLGTIFSASMISSTLSTSETSCLIGRFGPLETGEVIGPGTADKPFPCSTAQFTVENTPLSSRATTTTTPQERPAMIYFAGGSVRPRALPPSEIQRRQLRGQ